MDVYDSRDFLSEIENTSDNEEKSNILEFYNDKNIFITGASGFLGTLILEKLLRVCKNVNKIYVLFRGSSKKTINDRLVDYFNDEVFEKMKLEVPNYAEKIQILEGDLTKDNYGLRKQDICILNQHIHVVFHIGATVKFDETLDAAFNINVKGTNTIIKLAEKMHQLQSIVYVSTAYSNCDQEHIEEDFYDPVFTDKEIEILLGNSHFEEQVVLKPIILNNKPNSYIFTKSISEQVVKNNLHLPICIVRPSIIMPTLKDPLPYWSREQNSVLALMAGFGIGLLRVSHYRNETKVDLVPGDMCANCILVAAWHKATVPNSAIIYNNVGYENPVKLGELTNRTAEYHAAAKETVSKVVWIAHFTNVKNDKLLYFLYYILHVLPGIFLSLMERKMGRKPIVMKIYRKLFFLFYMIKYFAIHDWTFTNRNTKTLLNTLNPKDKRLFDFDVTIFSWMDFSTVLYRCIARYFIKDWADFPKEVYKKQMKYIEPIDKGIILSLKLCGLYFVLLMLKWTISLVNIIYIKF